MLPHLQLVTLRRTGRWQLTFNSLIFVFSLVLLTGLWHTCRCDCLVEKQPTVKRLVFAQLWIPRSGDQGKQITLTIKQSLKSKIRDIVLRYCHIVPILHISVLNLLRASRNPSCRVTHTDTWSNYRIAPGLCPPRHTCNNKQCIDSKISDVQHKRCTKYFPRLCTNNISYQELSKLLGTAIDIWSPAKQLL